MDVRVVAEALEDVREHRIRLAVVQGHVWRGPNDDDRALAIEAELVDDARVGLEPREVVLLLEAGIAAHLALACSEAIESVLWNRVGDNDAACRAAAEAVLYTGELVVERVARRNAERPRDHGQLVRGMRQRDVEAAAARVPAECPEPTCHGS